MGVRVLSRPPHHRWLVTGIVIVLLSLVALVPATAGAEPSGTDPVTPKLATTWIVGLRSQADHQGMAAFQGLGNESSMSKLAGVPNTYLATLGPSAVSKANDAIASLLNDPGVSYVEPNITYSWSWLPNDPLIPEQNWINTIDLPNAWSLATGQSSVVVAVVDSGIRADHPDLKGKILSDGMNFLNDNSNVTDDYGHGTAVASIIAASGNNGIGIAGTAMGVSILPIKVGNADGAPVSAIAQGVDYAVDHGASVINLSLGSDSPSITLQNAIAYAYGKNVPVVASAGNYYNQVSFPANDKQVISVGATTLDGNAIASFSSRLSRVDLVAPGVDILAASWSAGQGDGYALMKGTSFSTPMVSGVVALMRLVNPNLSIEGIRNALTSTARNNFPPNTAGIGSGLLDADAALQKAMVPAFASVWQTADQPVESQAAHRTWLWGPYAFAIDQEPYAETAHGDRLVAYFDKARMEINNPYGDQSNPWFVTSGLLATEMITGKIQTGNNSFQQSTPADVPVAGDPDDPNGPRYSSFTNLIGATPPAAGSVITQTVDASGNVGKDQHFAQYNVTEGDLIPETNHRVASVFAQYLQSNGIVLQNGQYQTGPLFSPAFYATGYPITEAYWANVLVGGTPHDVLVQCFQRRCLTYTPSNADGWKVEMGNVGRHYYTWRYGTEPPATPAPGNPTALVTGPK